MLVYHGSYCEIVNPDIKYSRNKLKVIFKNKEV